LKPWIDTKQLAVRAAVEISYVPEEWQKILYILLCSSDGSMTVKLDAKQAKTIRNAYEEEPDMDRTQIRRTITHVIIGEEKPKSKPKTLKLKADFYQKYFGENTAPEEALSIIEEALDNYFNL
jgi:hypothetical protein